MIFQHAKTLIRFCQATSPWDEIMNRRISIPTTRRFLSVITPTTQFLKPLWDMAMYTRVEWCRLVSRSGPPQGRSLFILYFCDRRVCPVCHDAIFPSPDLVTFRLVSFVTLIWLRCGLSSFSVSGLSRSRGLRKIQCVKTIVERSMNLTWQDFRICMHLCIYLLSLSFVEFHCFISDCIAFCVTSLHSACYLVKASV